jgi:hypothetical protein
MDSISFGCIDFVAPRALAAAARVVVCLSLYTIMPSLWIPVRAAHPLNGAAQDADITVYTSGEAKLYHREGCSLLAEPKAVLALSVVVDRPRGLAILRWVQIESSSRFNLQASHPPSE